MTRNVKATRIKPHKRTLTRGERVCAFIEKYCVCPEGVHVGEPMVLLPFERKFILEVYDNPHGTHTAYLSVGKKNGKTSLIASLLLAHIAGPEAVQNSQIASGAQSKDQAAVIFELARKMVDLSEKLSAVVRVMPSGKRLLGLMRNVLYRALAAEGRTAHGISPRVLILDEVGQVEGPVDRFISAVTTAQGAYDDPLLIAISTQAPTDNDLFSLWLDRQKLEKDPHVVCHLYTAPPDCALDDRDAWRAANPALGVYRSIKDVEKQAKAAMLLPTNEPEFRNFILNQRVESVAPFVSRGVWKANGAASGPIKGKVYAGLDLASVNDLAAFVAIDETGGVHPTFWLPEVGLREKSLADHVPYDIWAKQGYLQTTPGNAIEYEFIAKFLRAFFLAHSVERVGFDRYNMKFLKPWLEKEGFSEKELAKFVEFGQGTASMTPALREFEVKLMKAQLRHGMHPVLNMCSDNARVIGDSGARKFDKKKARGRIDGMVAAAMAIGVMPSAAEEKPKKYQMLFV